MLTIITVCITIQSEVKNKEKKVEVNTMTNKQILDIINKENENNEIKWKVIKNTRNLIVLTNDYDKNIKFKIEVLGEKDIKVTDVNGWVHNIAFLLFGTDRYSDFSDMECGLRKAIKLVVQHFYYCY